MKSSLRKAMAKSPMSGPAWSQRQSFPFECSFEKPEEASRRVELANWITSPDNAYFAKSYVNRLWGYLMGVGLIEPIDDIRASNTASNPELLDYLTQQFIEYDFDVRHVMRLICKSRTYQLSVDTNRWNEDDGRNYSHATARRLPAEVLFDSIHYVVGSTAKIPGVPAGTRAAELPDSNIKLADGFLANLGRPPRESACECERVNDLQLGPVMALISGPTVGNAIADAENAIQKLVDEQPNDARLINELFLRILNRPATAEEIAAVLDSMDAITQDHAALNKALAEREKWWTERKPQLEQARQKAIAEAKAELEKYQQKIAPQVAEANQQREARIAEAQKQLDEFLAKTDEHVAAWAKKHASNTEWHLLEAASLNATKGVDLARKPDRSIRATGDAKKATYTIEVKTRLNGIRAFRLETLPIPGQQGGGPGLPPNGNFVVTEFEVQVADAAKPKEFKKVALHKPVADFSQEGFAPAQAIDGNPRDQRGWAISPATGIVHWATFEAKEPIGSEKGTILKFVIHQNHNAEQHILGRFRIAATTDPESPGLSLPESLKVITSVAADQRSEEDKKLLADYFRKTNGEVAKRNAALAEANKPVPEDPGVTQRKRTLEIVSREIQDDGPLVQLRQDAEQSKLQMANIRLTAAQDLAWALINNPAFLFNH